MKYRIEKFTRGWCIKIIDSDWWTQLISHIQEFLIEHQTKFYTPWIFETVLPSNMIHLWICGIFYLENVCKEPKILFSSVNLKAPLLELLKRDDLKRRWNWIWKILLKCRFYDIEPTDLFNKVYCYKDILPQELIHDLLEFHIVPIWNLYIHEKKLWSAWLRNLWLLCHIISHLISRNAN